MAMCHNHAMAAVRRRLRPNHRVRHVEQRACGQLKSTPPSISVPAALLLSLRGRTFLLDVAQVAIFNTHPDSDQPNASPVLLAAFDPISPPAHFLLCWLRIVLVPVGGQVLLLRLPY